MSGEGMIAEQRAVHGDAGSLRLKQLITAAPTFSVATSRFSAAR